MRPDLRLRFFPAFVVGIGLSLPTLAHAQPDTTKADEATAALKKGYELKKAGKCAEAVVFLRESFEKKPSAKAVLNWAECEESAGRFLAARAHYQEGKRLADAEKQPELAQVADARIAAIGPRIPRVTFAVPEGASLVVDGSPRKAEGEVELDPGEHRVQVKREGYTDGTEALSVTPGEHRAVRLALGDKSDPAAPKIVPTPGISHDAPSAGPSPEASSGSGSGQRVAGAITAGAGVVIVGVGAVLALGAKSSYDSAVKASCDPSGCDSAGRDAIASARGQADVGTVLFVVGGVATGLGAVLFFTAKRSPVRAQVAGTGLLVSGTF